MIDDKRRGSMKVKMVLVPLIICSIMAVGTTQAVARGCSAAKSSCGAAAPKAECSMGAMTGECVTPDCSSCASKC